MNDTKIISEKFGGYKNSTYLCTVKSLERYEKMPLE